MPVSIVPTDVRHTVYQLLDDLGEPHGHVWPEIGDDEANEANLIQWIIEGQFERPVRVIAFNTDEGWSRDITREIAVKLLDLNREGTALGEAAREFVERVTGKTARAIV